ncbi:MAG: aminotransferase class V-fold PLP-dependent enzyme [Phaeodactylibacter sp.]|uniref:aminotransferase class V-fold PLP-dependent enzyme n=1 Tax=Phaeodactylibacter sp. TaxID=1940289 RepID=UPI0032ED8475
MQSRRRFFSHMGTVAGTLVTLPFFQTDTGKALLRAIAHQPTTQSEDFWRLIQQAYTVSPTILNLNNGGVSPSPRVVQEAVERYNRLSNEAPSYYMWRILDNGREPLRAQLADLLGSSPEEVAINRNASEALETVIFGLQLKPGDEVVLSRYDYPNMMNAWKQRARRDGIVLKWVDLDLPMEEEAAIAQRYIEQFSDKTRVVHLTHMINWNGQVLPVRLIAEQAHAQGIEVIVDAAHSFVHLDFKVEELQCDYLGTSLHKWLCAPFGSGLLYVRKSKIAGIYPLFAAPEPDSGDIRKFEHLGTRSFAIEQAIGQAVQFHKLIGSARKESRLKYLRTYWLDQVRDLPGFRSYTPENPDLAGAIANVGFEGKDALDFHDYLFREHKIHTVAIKWEGINGLRITPNVYTLTEDLDRLVLSIREYVKTN